MRIVAPDRISLTPILPINAIMFPKNAAMALMTEAKLL
jgi:hypothetical protein